MNILVENGSHHMLNMGDVGMLQVGLQRILDHYPDANLHVITQNPERLLNIFPFAIPVSSRGMVLWQRKTYFSRLVRHLPAKFSERLNNLENKYTAGSPHRTYFLKRRFTNINQRDAIDLDEYFQAIKNADAVISTGNGLINDMFVQSSQALLDTFTMAHAFHKPTAMFGLGFGPLENYSTIEKVRAVFPRLKILCFREGLTSLPLMSALGIQQDNVIVTGDDAVELAYQPGKQISGNYLGFNLRLSNASQVSENKLAEVKQVLKEVSSRLQTQIIPIPVIFKPPYDDISSIKKVIGSLKVDYQDAEAINTPADLVRQISRCRIVITGAYHSAVYALAQGIPVIALAKSEYYQSKFGGLSDQFGGGCKIVYYDDPCFRFKLFEEIIDMWNRADQYRDHLLAAAECQVLSSRSAWKQFLINLS
jgi:polysaccharide pyruvyl transferase WcaK-like protein